MATDVGSGDISLSNEDHGGSLVPLATPRSTAGTSGGSPDAKHVIITDSESEPASQPLAASSAARQHLTVPAAGMTGFPRSSSSSPGHAHGSAVLQRRPSGKRRRKRRRVTYHLGAIFDSGDALRTAAHANSRSQGSQRCDSAEDSEASGSSPPGSGPSYEAPSGKSVSGGEGSGLTGSPCLEDRVTQALGIKQRRTRRQHVSAQQRAFGSQALSGKSQHSGALGGRSVRDEARLDQSAVSAPESTAQAAVTARRMSRQDKAAVRCSRTDGHKTSPEAGAAGAVQSQDIEAADIPDAPRPRAATVADAVELDDDTEAARLEAEYNARQQALNAQQAATEALLTNRELRGLQPFHFDKCVLCAPCTHYRGAAMRADSKPPRLSPVCRAHISWRRCTNPRLRAAAWLWHYIQFRHL